MASGLGVVGTGVVDTTLTLTVELLPLMTCGVELLLAGAGISVLRPAVVEEIVVLGATGAGVPLDVAVGGTDEGVEGVGGVGLDGGMVLVAAIVVVDNIVVVVRLLSCSATSVNMKRYND